MSSKIVRVQVPQRLRDRATGEAFRRGLALLEERYPHGWPWDAVCASEPTYPAEWSVPDLWVQRLKAGALPSRLITTAALELALAQERT